VSATSATENERFGDRRGDELPPELADPKTRKARLRQAMRELEAEWAAERAAAEEHNARCQADADARAAGRGPNGRPRVPRPIPDEPAGRVNLTDPDSRPVRTHRGFIQGYNAQAAATEDQIVVTAEVLVGGTDQGLLAPMTARIAAELDAAGIDTPIGTLIADAGYWNAEQIQALRDQGLDALVTPDADPERPSNIKQPLAEELRARLRTDAGRALYAKRKHLIEPVFGQTKTNRRIDRFQRRGLAACRSEWRLITATHNLLKLWRHTTTPAAAAA
jgi:hypothetical protein